MTQYKLKLFFTDLDENLNTDQQAYICFDIFSDNFEHAELLAQRLEKIHSADNYEVIK